MPVHRLLRFEDRASLVDQTATRLLEAMTARQIANGSVSLCLTGGELGNEIYDRMALHAASSDLQPDNMTLWWNWDYFIATDNPERNSLQALSRLAGAWSLEPSRIHPIPSSSVFSDPEAGAAQYALDLKEAAPIDLCLVELSAQGQIAGIFPRHLKKPSADLVAGVTDAPLKHRQLVTMTRAGLNSCREIWILATGAEVAPKVRQVADHDPTLPASYLVGSDSLLWLADTAATSELPFHHCTL